MITITIDNRIGIVIVVLLMLLLIANIQILFNNEEHMDSLDPEVWENISQIYNKDNLIVTNLTVTGKITTDDIDVNKNLNVTGWDVNRNDGESGKSGNLQFSNGDSKVLMINDNKGKLYVSKDSINPNSLYISNWRMHTTNGASGFNSNLTFDNGTASVVMLNDKGTNEI